MRPKSPEKLNKPVERSRLHILAALLTGGSVVSLGLTSVVLRVLSQPDRSKHLLKVSLAEYIRTLHDFVRPPIVFEPGDWVLTEDTETQQNEHQSKEIDANRLDLKALVLDGVPEFTGDYRFIHYSADGSPRNHTLRLTDHGTIGKDENWQNTLLGQDKGKLENPTSLAAISIDSLPTLVTASLAKTLTEPRQMVPKDHFASEQLRHVEQTVLNIFANGWLPELPATITFLATDIGLPMGEIKEQIFTLQNNLTTSIEGFQNSVDILSYVYLIKTAMALPIAVGQSYIASQLQGNEKPIVTRRRFIQLATGAAIVGGHLAMGNHSGQIAIDVNAIRKEIDELAWIFNLPLQVKDRMPANFIGRVHSFLDKNEKQIPAIAYFLFVRELVTAYKEIAMLQSGNYTSDMQPNSMSLWGNVHDTKIGLYSLTKSELLTCITQAFTRFPTLFKLCFGQQPTPEEALNNRAYSGAHELYTACAYRADAHGVNKEWNIAAIEVWQFPELKAIVENGLVS
jgi:hypothetical protein